MAITVLCSASDPAAVLSESWTKDAGFPVYLKTFAKGCVVNLREYNGYDDSDFFASYWDAESESFKEVCYASTRGWTYPAGASIDAPPEIIEKYRAYNEGIAKAHYAACKAIEDAKPKAGKSVKVVRPVRGKAALKGGETGKVFWYGVDSFSRSYNPGYRVGIELDGDGRKVFISAGAVEVVS
jgi:hypothetical protein